MFYKVLSQVEKEINTLSFALVIREMFLYLVLYTLYSVLYTLYYTPSNNLLGSSNNCFTRTKKPTDSRPSIIR